MLAVVGPKDGTFHGGGTEAEEAPMAIVASASPSDSSASVSHSSASGWHPIALMSHSSASASSTVLASVTENAQYVLALPSSAESQNSLDAPPQLYLSNSTDAERSNLLHEGGDNQDKG